MGSRNVYRLMNQFKVDKAPAPMKLFYASGLDGSVWVIRILKHVCAMTPYPNTIGSSSSPIFARLFFKCKQFLTVAPP